MEDSIDKDSIIKFHGQNFDMEIDTNKFLAGKVLVHDSQGIKHVSIIMMPHKPLERIEYTIGLTPWYEAARKEVKGFIMSWLWVFVWLLWILPGKLEDQYEKASGIYPEGRRTLKVEYNRDEMGKWNRRVYK